MTRHKTSSRLLAMLLSLILVIGVLPTMVFADGHVAYIGNTGYATLAQAVSQADPGDTILLTADDSTAQQIEISENLTIELDGHSLPSTAFKITAGTVTIGDRKGTGIINGEHAAGFVATENSRCSSSIYVTGTANVTLNNLRVEQCAEDDLEKAIFLGGSASLTINGGNYTGPKDAGVDAIFYYNNNTSSSLTINDGHFEANCALSVNKTPGTGGGTLVIRKATFVGNGTAFWIEQEYGGVTTQEDAERFLADSSGSYIVGSFDQANIVIGSGLFVSDGFTGPEYGSTDSDNPAELTPEDGDSITLLPQILGGDGSDYTYTWFKDGEPISGAAASSYTIENYQSPEDDGLYSVIVSQGDNRITLYWQVGEKTSAQDAVAYLNENGDEQTLTDDYTPVTSDVTAWSDGWYVVEGDVSIDSRVTVTGDVKLILKDGANLTVNGGLLVRTNDSFTVYAQSQGTGALNAISGNGAGIGGGGEGSPGDDCGTINIHGGIIKATCSFNGAGIGDGLWGNATGKITITGGVVTASGTSQEGISGILSTGANGNAVIYTDGIDPENSNSWSCILFNSDDNTGTVYGTSVTVDESFEIPEGYQLTVGSGQTLTIPSGVKLTNKGSIVNNGRIENSGEIINDGGQITQNPVTGNSPVTYVPYLDENGAEQVLSQQYIEINGENLPAVWQSGWYVVEGEVSIDSRVTVSGDVKLILRDSSNLTVNGGIDVSEGNSFTVYAQSTGDSMGQLTADASNVDSVSGIGGEYGDGGTITINGGTIEATGGRYGSGIGGGNRGDGGTITINGGTVTATGGTSGGAGIGGGYRGSSGAITLSGGIITATGGRSASGIGGGYMVSGGNISTGENGTAVIFASFIPTSNTTGWKGLIFNVNNGKIYGDSYTVEGALTIPDGKTLTVEDGKTLNGGANITNNGTIKVNMGGTYSGDQPTNNKVIYQIDWDTDGDGDVDETEYVAYGETPSHEDGSKASTTDTVYTFTGWDPEIVTVTGTATYTARFSSDTRTYTVTVPTGEGYTIQYSGGTELPYNSNFTFTVEIGQGYYKTAGFAVQVNGTALTPDKDGNYTVEVLTDTRITVEGVAKESALAAPTVDTHGYDGAWTADNVTLTPSATADSGIAYYEYSKDDGKSWTSLTGNSLTISESDFAKDYIFRAVSNAGNVSPESDPVTVQIDKAKPDVTFDGNITDYLQEDTLKIIPIIGLSGISQVELKKDNGEWITLNPSADNPNTYFYTVTENGLYTVRVTSGTGVVGDEKSITYDKIDSTEPVVTIDSGSYRSGNWTNENVTLSVSNTASNLGTATFWYKVDKGEWQAYTDDIIVSEETDGAVYTFKAISASGVESAEASITVKLDKTAPDGDVEIAESSVKKFINTITFGLFFNQNVDVTITGTDDLSGVAAVEYYRSEEILTEDDVLAIEDWTVYSSISETAEAAAKFVYYVKITDHAGNVTYFGSDGVTFDLTAPVIEGVTNGATYYTTQSVTVSDANLESITLNDETVGETFTIEGNKEETYTIVATDKAGNKTTYTVTMKPIASLAETIEEINTGNVTSEDKETVETVKEQIESIDLEDATEDEKTALQEILDKCNELVEKIEESVQAGNTENTDKVEDITADNVKPENKDDLTAAKEDLENALENFGDNYTEGEKAEIQDKLDQINKALESIEKVETVEDAISKLPDTVEPDDAETEALINTAKEQYDALTDHEKSLIPEELKEKLESLLGDLLDYRIIEGDGSKWTLGDDASLTITANGSVEKFTGIEVDGKAVDAANYTVKSGSTIISLKPEYLNTLSVGKHTLTVIYTDGETSGEFEILKDTETPTPDTGDSSSMVLWITLMFIAVCGLSGAMVYGRKKKYGK